MTETPHIAVGVDIGGSGIKGAVVDTRNGDFLTDRVRIATPQPATPDAVADTVVEVLGRLEWQGMLACAIPSVIRHGVVASAANIDKSWIGVNAPALFSEKVGRPVRVLNDADAAGIAEMRMGAGRDEDGVVCLLTFGTGIGSALFLDGRLVPNTELGHLLLRGTDAEHWASANAREEEELSWEEWGSRVDEYLDHVESLLSPDLFIIGGGISKQSDEFFKYINVEARLVPAAFRNRAGIIGAAVTAVQG